MVNINSRSSQSPVNHFNRLNRSLAMSELKQKRQNNNILPANQHQTKPVSNNSNNNPSTIYSLNYGGTDYAVSTNPNGTFNANVNEQNYNLSLGENNMLTVTHGKNRAQIGQVVSDGDGTYSVANNQQQHQPQPANVYSLNYGGTDYAITYNANNNTFTTNVNGTPLTLTGGQNNMLFVTNGNVTSQIGQVISDGDGTFSIVA